MALGAQAAGTPLPPWFTASAASMFLPLLYQPNSSSTRSLPMASYPSPRRWQTGARLLPSHGALLSGPHRSELSQGRASLPRSRLPLFLAAEPKFSPPAEPPSSALLSMARASFFRAAEAPPHGAPTPCYIFSQPPLTLPRQPAQGPSSPWRPSPLLPAVTPRIFFQQRASSHGRHPPAASPCRRPEIAAVALSPQPPIPCK
jgi:hypothetical protein